MVGCNPRTLEAKAGRSKVQGQSEYIEKKRSRSREEKKWIVWLDAKFYIAQNKSLLNLGSV